ARRAGPGTQAVDGPGRQPPRGDWLRRAPAEPTRPPLTAGLPDRTRRVGSPGHARGRRACRTTLGRADQPSGVRGAARRAAAPAERAQRPIAEGDPMTEDAGRASGLRQARSYL